MAGCQNVCRPVDNLSFDKYSSISVLSQIELNYKLHIFKPYS